MSGSLLAIKVYYNAVRIVLRIQFLQLLYVFGKNIGLLHIPRTFDTIGWPEECFVEKPA